MNTWSAAYALPACQYTEAPGWRFCCSADPGRLRFGTSNTRAIYRVGAESCIFHGPYVSSVALVNGSRRYLV